MKIEKSVRYRINIKETAKKEKYFECTTDMTGYAMANVLEASDLLVARLDKRYPPPIEDKK